MKVILIDNNDSFTYNLFHLLAGIGMKVEVVPYPQIPEKKAFDLLVISPGPGNPADYPEYRVLKARPFPVLGICLGMQVMNRIAGGRTARLDGCVHGKTDVITMDNKKYTVARYHSLYCSQVAAEFEIIAVNGTGIPMAIRHRSRPWIGYQFHPESFLTKGGTGLVRLAINDLVN